MKIFSVDAQGYALSEEDVDNIATSDLFINMLKNRVVFSTNGEFDYATMSTVDITGFYYLEQIDHDFDVVNDTTTNTYRMWFEHQSNLQEFMDMLALQKLSN